MPGGEFFRPESAVFPVSPRSPRSPTPTSPLPRIPERLSVNPTSPLPGRPVPLAMPLALAMGLALGLALLPATPAEAQAPTRTAAAQDEGAAVWQWNPNDPRIGLRGGVADAEQASWNMQLLANVPRPEGFSTNSDLAFSGPLVFMGNYNGFNVYDVTDPRNPVERLSVLCPGNQGDLSVFGNLLFKSVQAAAGRLDCGTEGVDEPVSDIRFRGVRIFDMTNLDELPQIAAVQTCRGSHTHTLVTRPGDHENVYVYVSGTSAPRPAEEMEGCSGADPDEDPNTSLFRIEVIQVPLAAPHEARVVNEPRVFADPVTGDIAGLWSGGDHGEGTQRTSRTAACHDITTFPGAGVAGGACSGNGILFDISNPAVPVRLDEVVDPSFAYWHSATFSNDGTTVIFTDEWGGGSAPRCLATDPPEWGANAIFEVVDGRMRFRSYYKLPAPQTETENCVAHNGSLVPVPGRDIKVQAWYQGGVSVFDFTDPSNPFEIAYFDRGPMSATDLMTGGYWSTYWYNGHIYGSEIGRGFDVLRLVPSEHLTRNELEAALLVNFSEFNPQMQPSKRWPPAFVVARAYLDQLERNAGLGAEARAHVARELDRLEGMAAGPDRRTELTSLAIRLERSAVEAGDPGRVRAMAEALRDLANAEPVTAQR